MLNASMVDPAEMLPVNVVQAMLVNIAKNQCVKNLVKMVADASDPTDVPVSMDTLVDIVKLTTELDPVSEGLKMNNALDNWKV